MGTLLVIKLFVLTVIQHDKWQSYVDDVSQRAIYETAPRGDIIDRKGRIIATSRPVYSVILNKVNLITENALEAASEVNCVLAEQGEDVLLTQTELRESLEVDAYESYLPIVLAEDVTEETVNRIKSMKIPGVQITTNYRRIYPHGNTASHVIGYLGLISEEEYEAEPGYRKDSIVGKDGIENVYEHKLKGKDGQQLYQVDSQGNVIDKISSTDPVKGENVQLTLDMDMQKVTENALKQAVDKASCGGTFQSDYGQCNMVYADKASSGAAVAIEIKTGKVLAMASYPDYDPNVFTGTLTEETWESLQRENPYDSMSAFPLYNLATMTSVQPGSTFKPVTALAALRCGLNKNERLLDNGKIDLGGFQYGCHLWNDNKETHGYVNLKEALKVSCNYYFYDISSGKDLATESSLNYDNVINNDVIVETARDLGLGNKTGIEISEAKGTLPSEEVKLVNVKNSLRNYLLRESEYYFLDEKLADRVKMRKNIEKITNWADNHLTLEEIIGKLGSADFVREDKVVELAEICKYEYFDKVGWNQGDTFNIAIGQGDNAYTTLQMANYMAAIGRGGKMMDVTLIETTAKIQNKITNLNKIDVKYIVECLTGVTSEKDGTLYNVFKGFPYKVAAKTGTAQKSGYINEESEVEYLRKYLHLIASDVLWEDMLCEAERLQNKYPDVYETQDMAVRRAVINLSKYDVDYEDIDRYKEKYDNFAWTVALAPADDPQIAVAVMIVQGKSSLNAAPAVREIIGNYGDITGWEKLF